MSRAWAEINMAAITHNARTLRSLAPDSQLCAVVKAGGYGHGAATAAHAALAGGATILGVAQVDEGVALRQAGFDQPIWILSEPEPHEFITAAGFQLEPAIYSPRGFKAAECTGIPITVHLKLDTGMHRVGAAPEDAVTLATTIHRLEGVELGSVWTHLAVADEPGNTFTDVQLDRFELALAALDRAGLSPPMTHAANSAGAIRVARSRRDVVRCGIALYGLPPSPALDGTADLRPALSLKSHVAFVKDLRPGDRVSYGQRTEVSTATTVATVPVGYADGVRRNLWDRGGAVLIRGIRRPILGVVTMDQVVVDCRQDSVVAGDEVVVLGRQADEEISATDWARSLDTINYEIVCGIGPRVERITV